MKRKCPAPAPGGNVQPLIPLASNLHRALVMIAREVAKELAAGSVGTQESTTTGAPAAVGKHAKSPKAQVRKQTFNMSLASAPVRPL